MWDLQRNGGNVVATTERILSGRGLEVVSCCLNLLDCFACWRSHFGFCKEVESGII